MILLMVTHLGSKRSVSVLPGVFCVFVHFVLSGFVCLFVAGFLFVWFCVGLFLLLLLGGGSNLDCSLKLPMETFKFVRCFYTCQAANNETPYPDISIFVEGILHTNSYQF